VGGGSIDVVGNGFWGICSGVDDDDDHLLQGFGWLMTILWMFSTAIRRNDELSKSGSLLCLHFHRVSAY
jgi:hypothetical protein